MEKKTVKIIRLLLCLILAAGVATVFRACAVKEDGTWMHCHEAQRDILILGIGMSVLSLLSLFIQNSRINAALDIAEILLGIICVLIPGTIVKMCMMSSMRCHSVMKPFVFVVGILVALASAVDAAEMLRKRK